MQSITPKEFLQSKGIRLDRTSLLTYIDGHMCQPDLCTLLEEYSSGSASVKENPVAILHRTGDHHRDGQHKIRVWFEKDNDDLIRLWKKCSCGWTSVDPIYSRDWEILSTLSDENKEIFKAWRMTHPDESIPDFWKYLSDTTFHIPEDRPTDNPGQTHPMADSRAGIS